MKRKMKRSSLAVVLVLLMLLTGCGGAGPGFTEVNDGLSDGGGGSNQSPGQKPAAAATTAPAATPAPATGKPNGAVQPVSIVTDPNRKIIKDATFIIEVKSVQISMSQIGNAAVQAGGYVLETRTESNPAQNQSAVVKIGVPVDTFEATLQRVRESAIKVISEQASGQDVSQEFVDTQSQIANLEATQARIREFLAQSKTVEESLKVNAELTTIEGQISQLKGRLQFLTQRAAFSTITVQLQQTPEPSPPAAAVVSSPDNWDPGKIASQAFGTLTTIGKALATILIWLSIVGLPLLTPLLLVWLIRRWNQRRPPAQSSQP